MKIARALSLPLAAGCAGLALWLAVHHPLSPPLAMAGVLLVLAWTAWRPFDGLFLLPALLPVIDLMPWTGWLLVEEFDLLLLAVAAGLYGRHALKPLPPGPQAAAPGVLGSVVLALWLAATGVALWRGVADAGGWQPGWWQAYREPMNALRLAKPAVAVLLLLPAWRGLQRADAARATHHLAWGLAAGHAAVSLVCLWERAAYPGLLNFSADYRTTALFWETLTGGAGLDAYLALTLPFTWWLLARARSRREFALAAGVVALGFYAVLTTFSRIVFLMLPLSLLLFGLATAWQRRGVAPTTQDLARRQDGLQPARWLPVMGLGLVGALLVFPLAGYRGLLAWLGNLLLLLLLGGRWALPGPAAAGQSLLAALALALPAAALAWWLPKGPYLVYGLVWLLTLGLALRRSSRQSLVLATAGWLVCAGLTVAVAAFWSEAPRAAAASVSAAVLGLLLCWPASVGLRRSLVPTAPRGQAGAFLSVVAVCTVVASLVGGEQLSERFRATGTDAGGRSQHWALSLGLRQSVADVLWGVGLGRFHDRFALAAPDNQRPGDIRWVTQDGAPVVRMVAGHHMLGWGELLRLSQRVTRPLGAVTVSVVASSDQPVALHGEVCVKHLLYDAGCVAGSGRSAAGIQGRQTLRWVLGGEGLRAAGNDPLRFLVFSLATESRMPITLHEVSARDAAGVELLHNGGFQQGAARWFVSSDRNHMPWHAKSLWVHLLVEQGLAGTAVFVLWVLLAVGGLLLGPGRRHPLAPALLAAIGGALVVGSIDSLLDMPRIAWLLTWLLAVASMLALPRTTRT